MAVDLDKLLTDSIKQAAELRGQFNLLMAGITGVGKSTLVNAVFSENLAQTGQGRPVTLGTREYSRKGFPLTLFDTRGLETARYRETLQELQQLINKRRTGDEKQQIHACWLCISEDSRRVQEAEIELARLLHATGVPVLVVITKARSDQGFADVVRELIPHAHGVYRLRALSEVLDDGHVLRPFGLEELLEATMELIPEASRNALAAAQKVSMDLKVRRARAVVSAASVSAAAAAAVPLPMSNLFTLAPVQLGMLAGINATFGVRFSQTYLQTVLASALGVAGTGYATRALAGALLKFVPGLGTAAGGFIAATTASALTAAMGNSYVMALRLSLERAADNQPDAQELAQEFEQQFRRRGREIEPPQAP